MKINNDKYYTSRELAKYCIDKTYEIIGESNISEVIEPSAGSGNFSTQIPSFCWAYDIEPEHTDIVKQDYLELDVQYLPGRLIIGNPPYGDRNSLSVKFFKKSIKIADHIAFILPVSQYNNTQQMYEFDLIYTEDLGVKEYSNQKIHCCFNIYTRPNGTLNKKNSYKLKDVEVKEFRRGGNYKKPTEYHFGMCSWGASLGKEVEYVGQYAQENYIIVKNKIFYSKIIDICKNTNWKELYPYTSTPKIQTWKIYKYLKEKIPNLE